jgi:fatty-acyl-CoA synthase
MPKTDAVCRPHLHQAGRMIAPKVPSLERIVILTDDAHMPETSLANAVSYESYIGEADGDFTWAEFDERTAAGMCYTSGTTGDPEGRGLLAPLQCSPRAGSASARHAQSGVPRPADAGGAAVSCQWLVDGLFGPMSGCAMIMPGAGMDGESIYQMLTQEKVTITAAVPTVWLMLLQNGKGRWRAARFETGGDRRFGLPARDHQGIPGRLRCRGHPRLGHDRNEPARNAVLDQAGICRPDRRSEKLDLQAKQGHPPFTVEMKITDDDEQGAALGRQDLRPAQGARPGGVLFLLQGPRRRTVRRRRLVRHRRRRPCRRIRLHADHRSGQGRHQVRRRMDFLDRD